MRKKLKLLFGICRKPKGKEDYLLSDNYSIKAKKARKEIIESLRASVL